MPSCRILIESSTASFVSKADLFHYNHQGKFVSEKQKLSSKKIAVRLPNWLGDVCMVLPIFRALQTKVSQENPGAEITIFVQPQYVSLLNKLGVEADIIALPKKNWRYFFHFLSWRGEFDDYILFTNSERGDLEAWMTRATSRYGIARPQKPRKLLTHRYVLDKQFDEQALHQTRLWENFTRHFNLITANELDLTPFFTEQVKKSQVGLICGSANTPEKRWAIDNWQNLASQLLTHFDEVVLLGTPDDVDVCQQIQAGVKGDKTRVTNLAGKTSLAGLIDVMAQQQLVIGNDTGGLHLANLLGVPVIGLYGFTNPVRCHPIFDAPLVIIESPKGYGKGVMSDIGVDEVLSVVEESRK